MINEQISSALDDMCIRLKRDLWYIEDHYDIYCWPQIWGNTSGGFQTIGGNCMTKEYVIIFKRGNYYHVYFGGRLGYMLDIIDYPWFGEHFDAKHIPGIKDFERLCNSENG